MPYLDCPSCRLTVYTAPRLTPLDKCPRCGSKQVGEPGHLFGQVSKFQRSVGGVRPQDPNRPAARR
jgi:hypothetical protein